LVQDLLNGETILDYDLARQAEEKLLKTIKEKLPELETLLKECSDKWVYDDGIYRFYHQSFKVFRLPLITVEIVTRLQGLASDLTLNEWFSQIVSEGTGKEFTPDTNANWLAETRPILEAFFHAKYFLEMVCKYGKEIESPPEIMPCGWASVLYLYGLR
jgi:hypothetical protein